MQVLSIMPHSTAGINNRQMKSNTNYISVINSTSTFNNQPSFEASKKPTNVVKIIKRISSAVGANVYVNENLYDQLAKMCVSPTRIKKWKDIARDVMEGKGRELDGEVQSFKKAAEKAGVRVKVNSKFKVNKEDDSQGIFKEMTIAIQVRPSIHISFTKWQGFKKGQSTVYIDEMNLGNKGYKTDGFIKVLMKGLNDAVKDLNSSKK